MPPPIRGVGHVRARCRGRVVTGIERFGRSKAEVEQGEERQKSVLVKVEKAQLQPFHVLGYVHESGNLYALTIFRDVHDRGDLRSMHVVGNIDDGADLCSVHVVSDVGNARKLRTGCITAIHDVHQTGKLNARYAFGRVSEDGLRARLETRRKYICPLMAGPNATDRTGFPTSIRRRVR
jgi:hypothetical protein